MSDLLIGVVPFGHTPRSGFHQSARRKPHRHWCRKASANRRFRPHLGRKASYHRSSHGRPEPGLALGSRGRSLARTHEGCGRKRTDSLESFEADFLNRLACHSAAIEGSTLDALQTQLVLEGEFVPADNKELSDLFAVRGVAEGYDWARREMAKGRRIDAEFIKDIHERTALDAQPRVRGTYRSAAVLIVGAPFTPPAPLEIAPNMDLLLEQFAASSQHPLVSAAAFHAMFEMVHPFLDGNGRVGRTVLNLMLLKAGLPAVALKSNNRLAYLETLAAWQTTGNGADFIAILTENVEAELEARREILTESMG